MPPKIMTLDEDLKLWIADLESIKATVENTDNEESVKKYREWIAGQQRKVAPGFNFDVMKPVEKKA